METQPLYQQNYMQENQFRFKNDGNSSSTNIALIISQILIWIILVYTVFNPDFYPLLIFAYILYVILELCSPTSLFLLNKKSTNSLYNKLKEIFSSHPVLQLNVSCYHIEKRTEKTTTKEGKEITREIEERKETYRERRDFGYYSFRDVSGLFRIDLDNEVFRNKIYIKLTLDTMISFADAISYYDYQTFKNNFIFENQRRDKQMDFKENFYIDNLSKNNLIKIKNEEPYYINYFCFLICTLLTLALPYEIMLNNISIEGKYQIRKLISTRYNLNDPVYDGMYGNSIPAIKLGNDTFNFNTYDYGYYNTNAEINLPTEEEIENAKKYEDNIKTPIYDDHLFDGNNNAGYPDLDLPTQEEVNNSSYKYD